MWKRKRNNNSTPQGLPIRKSSLVDVRRGFTGCVSALIRVGLLVPVTRYRLSSSVSSPSPSVSASSSPSSSMS